MCSTEFLIAGEAFYKTLIGETNYIRWQCIKEENQFYSEVDFVNWMLDIVEKQAKVPKELYIEANYDTTNVNYDRTRINIVKPEEETDTIEDSYTENSEVIAGTEQNQNKRKLISIINPKRKRLLLPKCSTNTPETNNVGVLATQSAVIFAMHENNNVTEQLIRDGTDKTTAVDGAKTTLEYDNIGSYIDDDEAEDGGENDLDEEQGRVGVAEDRPLMCPMCGIVCSNSSSLLEHLQERHYNMKGVDVDKVVHDLMQSGGDSCVFCRRVIVNRNNMSQHIRGSHLNWHSVCETCNKEFTSSRNLTRHRLTVHLGIRNFPCSYCSDAFKRSHHLARHIERKHALEFLGSSATRGFTGGSNEESASMWNDSGAAGMFGVTILSSDNDDSLEDIAIPSLHHDASSPNRAAEQTSGQQQSISGLSMGDVVE